MADTVSTSSLTDIASTACAITARFNAGSSKRNSASAAARLVDPLPDVHEAALAKASQHY
jgi:hypothetical protein